MMKSTLSVIGYIAGSALIAALGALFALAAFFQPWEVTAILKSWGLA